MTFTKRGWMSLVCTVTLSIGMFAEARTATAQETIQISIENNQTDGGFFLTPLWFGIHNGTYDLFQGDNSTAATAGLEALAEGGDASTLMTEFSAAVPSGLQDVILSPGGFAGAPVIDPGEIAMTSITVGDTIGNRFFSYASMVIPSNDAFIGNEGEMDYAIFDAAGVWNGPITIQIFGGTDVWDAGTEVNDGLGAAFSANGGTATDESLNVRLHPGLGNFVGTDTAAMTTITSDLGNGELLATITISRIPEPGSLTLLGLGTTFIAVRRRRRA